MILSHELPNIKHHNLEYFMTISSVPHINVRISCIICAFNEAPRIAAVLAIASVHPFLDEIIVVNDGSTDNTVEIVRHFTSVKLISHPVNRGKSAAMATGIAMAQNGILMLLDADLTGLAVDNITALATPVLSGVADVSISLRQNSLWIFRAIGLDFISGERVIRKELLSEALEDIYELPRFGIEVFMNRRIIAHQLSISVTHWPHVTQSRKIEKLGFWKGLRAEWRMMVDLLQVAYPSVLISQTYHLLSLRTIRTGAKACTVQLRKLRDNAI
jgi:glycosyltransferase involved in cell wall biosynthesis